MAASRIAKILASFLAVLLLTVGMLSIALIYVPAPVEKWLQARVLLAVQSHYGDDVQLENLHVSVIPVFRVSADNFVMPNRGHEGRPPLFTISHFTAEALPTELLAEPIHLNWVKLEGLVIHIPPKGDAQDEEVPTPKHSMRLANFVVDRIDADGADLFVLSKTPGREPMEWAFRTLTLHSAGIGQPMRFTAELTNPKPPGLIHTSGTFGPWNTNEPSGTAVAGHYQFQNADLSAFNGISGTLSSVGDYTGSLVNITVDGTTDTPNFKLDSGSRAVHLTTSFHAVVNGTNGNTYLQPVNAHFLSSNVVARGEVSSNPGEKGKTIALDINVSEARVQDLLEMAVTSPQAMLTGQIIAMAKLRIPPGKARVLQKLQLTGNFHIQDARFSSDKVKETIVGLSRRAQGKPNDLSIQDVPVELAGVFTMRDSTLDFSQLQFNVPGVVAQVKGTYGLNSEALNFSGDVQLQAHVSNTMTGVKRILLKPVDPVFARHNAGTYLPVNVTGAREHPQIKVDVKKVL